MIWTWDKYRAPGKSWNLLGKIKRYRHDTEAKQIFGYYSWLKQQKSSELKQGREEGPKKEKENDFPTAGLHPAHSFHHVGLCAKLIKHH